MSESQYDLINRADLDGLVRLIDDYCETRSWHDLLGLRDACKAAVANGRQVWPASTLAEYRLALLAPAEIAVQVVEILFAFLQIDLDRFWRLFRFSDEAWISPTASDVGETSDVAEDFTELIGAFPSDGKCADAAR